MSRTPNIDEMLLAQQWERCKGELRAMVRMQGSYATDDREGKGTSKWEQLEKAVEEYIQESVEGMGLHES